MVDLTNATPALNLIAIDIARYTYYVLVETVASTLRRFNMGNPTADFDRLIILL